MQAKPAQADHGKAYEGELTIRFSEGGIPDIVRLRIELDDRYPEVEPRAIAISGLPMGSQFHVQRGDNKLCLWLPLRSPWKPDDESAIEKFLDAVEDHCKRALIAASDPNEQYPGPQSAHGVNGYFEYLTEDEGLAPAMALFVLECCTNPNALGRGGRRNQCPCGSKKRIAHCHIESIRAHVERLEPFVSKLGH